MAQHRPSSEYETEANGQKGQLCFHGNILADAYVVLVWCAVHISPRIVRRYRYLRCSRSKLLPRSPVTARVHQVPQYGEINLVCPVLCFFPPFQRRRHETRASVPAGSGTSFR